MPWPSLLDPASAPTSAPPRQMLRSATAHRGKELAEWCQQHGGWELEIVHRPPGARGFTIQPRRWVVERSFAWLNRHRRLGKDDERKVQTSGTFLELAMIRLLLARQGRQT